MNADKQHIDIFKMMKYLIQSRNSDFCLMLPIGNNKQVKVPIGRISHITADGILSRCYLHGESQNHINIAIPFKDLELLLKKYAFVRVHRSHLVNCSYIKNWDCGEEGIIELTCGTKIPIARRKRSEIMSFLKVLGLDYNNN